MDTYAKIQNGIVVNTQIASSTDTFDSAFIWIIITNLTCIDGTGIQIGCSYDGTNFNQI